VSLVIKRDQVYCASLGIAINFFCITHFIVRIAVEDFGYQYLFIHHN